MTLAGRPFSPSFGVGGELDVDLVGFVDDVIVGDDVAARVDDEAGAEGAALGAVTVVVAVTAALAAEEAIEEVLHVALVGLVVSATRGRWPRRRGWRADCLGRDSVLMLTTAGPTCLTICEKPFERVTAMG